MALKNDVVWTLPKLVDYEKSHRWQKEVVQINNASEWVYGSILGDYVKKNIEKYIRLIM